MDGQHNSRSGRLVSLVGRMEDRGQSESVEA